MQNNGFKKSLFGLNGKQVMEYLDTVSSDIEKKVKMKDDDIKALKNEVKLKEERITVLEEKLEELENANTALKEEYEKEIENLKNAHQLEISEIKIEHNKELVAINDRINQLQEETKNEKDKISSAILNAENTAKNIIAQAQLKGEELLEIAAKKVEAEKAKLNKTKADVSDFTYDIKRILEKLNNDIKDKLKGDK